MDRLLDLVPPQGIEKISVIETQFKINSFPILLGRRYNGNYIGLFPASSADQLPSTPIKLSNGFEVGTFQLVGESSAHEIDYVEFGNVSQVDVTLFGAILDEVIRVVQDSESILVEIQKVLERWRDLLTLDSPNQLSINKVIGLLGELHLMYFLLLTKKVSSTDPWVGPNGARHDFEFESHSIEVKTTLRKRSNEISIHGIDQLNPFPGKEVRILKVRLEPDPHGISLPDLVSSIESVLGRSTSDFTEKLLRAGYRHENREIYQNLKFQFIEHQDIPVNKDFPRISRELLEAIDPIKRIQDIEYVVDVTGLAVATSAKLSGIDWSEIV
jgi:hypothetical protein